MAFNTKRSGVIGLVVLAIVIIAAGFILTSRNSTQLSSPALTSGEASLSLTAPVAGTIEVGDQQNVRWESTNYAAPTVAVNIIRKVGDNPARYELVRTVAPATPNDGEATWVPAKKDIGSNTFVEVGCVLSAQACHASNPTLALAIIDSNRYLNTAAAFEAIEQLNNK